jgi:hypothetical protein
MGWKETHELFDGRGAVMCSEFMSKLKGLYVKREMTADENWFYLSRSRDRKWALFPKGSVREFTARK